MPRRRERSHDPSQEEQLSPPPAANLRDGGDDRRSSREMCCVCMDRRANALLAPCSHLIVCVQCARRLMPPRCPQCRYPVQQITVLR
jgi:hypothetical protein